MFREKDKIGKAAKYSQLFSAIIVVAIVLSGFVGITAAGTGSVKTGTTRVEEVLLVWNKADINGKTLYKSEENTESRLTEYVAYAKADIPVNAIDILYQPVDPGNPLTPYVAYAKENIRPNAVNIVHHPALPDDPSTPENEALEYWTYNLEYVVFAEADILADAINIVYHPAVPDDPATPQYEAKLAYWTYNLVAQIIEYYFQGDGSVDIKDLAVAAASYGSYHLRGNVFPTYRFIDAIGEKFTDTNGNGIWDPAEPYVDVNSNGQYDEGEPFTDVGNGRWDSGEYYEDRYTINGQFDPWDYFIDQGNGVWDPAEPYVDANGNGQYDVDGINDTWVRGEIIPGRWNPVDHNGDGIPEIQSFDVKCLLLDIDMDGIRETQDACWAPRWKPTVDINRDGTIDIRDMAIMAMNYGVIQGK